MKEMRSSTGADVEQRWQNLNWYRALTLAERATGLQNYKDQTIAVSSSGEESARQRLLSWKEQKPFHKDAYFAQRLALDGLTEEDLLMFLAETPGDAQERVSAPPAWVEWLAESFDDPQNAGGAGPSEEPDEANNLEFSLIIAPLIKRGLLKLQSGILELKHKYTHLPFDLQSILLLLISHIPGYIDPKLHKTIILELNVARMQGRLQGDSAEERFGNFLRQLRRREGLQALFEEYPVLARLLTETIEHWAMCEMELLERLCADWEEIHALFTPASDPGVLTRIQAGQGDLHRGGRSTTILVWSSGFRLVYKPRPSAIDVHFQELLAWLNERGYQPAFRTFQVLDKGSYGWTEFVQTGPCASPEEVERFYQRQGGYLALLYALEATDFHAENLIAAGEHPILVDLEALFHPRVSNPSGKKREYPGSEAINHSVLRVGLLPQRIWANDQAEGVDISGIGGLAGQLSPTPVAKWVGVGTDQMHVSWERTELIPQNHQHRPRLHDQDVNTLDYSESVITGFTTLYRLLLDNREELLSEMLPRFARDEVRCVLRPTRIYDKLLRDSFHPNVLRDALDRNCLLDRLWIGIDQQPYFERIIAAEQADLIAADIPIFTTYSDSYDLFTSRGEMIAEFFAESGLEMVRKRISCFDEQDRERQTWIIRASFTSLTLGVDQTIRSTLQFDPVQTNVNVTSERLLKAARAIGDHLSKIALRDEDAVGWLGIAPVKEREWHLAPAGIDLYDGIPGIALFLGYLGKLTEEQRYVTLTQQALTTIRGLVEQQKEQSEPASIGAFSGLGSVIYLLSHLGSLWNDPALYREAEDMVKLIPGALAHDKMFDVIGGAAGCIAALLSLYNVAPSPGTLDTAILCGDYLIEHARPMKAGVGWLIKGEDEPLTGLAHGNAGLALNLLRLSAVTGEKRFHQTALAAMEYERDLFSPKQQNWPDLRKAVISKMLAPSDGQAINEENYLYIVAWCHGAPGIGLARLASLPFIDDKAIRAEIDTAVKTTLSEGFGRNHSLCHGDMGNLDVILAAAQRFPEPRLQEMLERLASALLDSIDSQGWVTGVPQGVEAPGLMVGLAGIGYELLRLATPEYVPSVLLLAPPTPVRA